MYLFRNLALPYILNAYMALSSLGAISLRTENMSTNSLKLRFPIPSSEKDSTILLRNGFSYGRRGQQHLTFKLV